MSRFFTKHSMMNNHRSRCAQRVYETILLLLLAVSLTGCSADYTTAASQITEQETISPLYEIAPETVESSQMADLPADELERVTRCCQAISDLCVPFYQNAQWEPSPYMPDQMILSQQSMDAMEAALIEQGYTVLDTDSTYPDTLQNTDGMYAFWQAVQSGQDAMQDYVWISPYGGFHYCALETRTDGQYFLEAVAEWDAQHSMQITELYKREVLDWELTANGNFYYKLYEAHSPAFEDYTLLRLRPVDKALYDLNAAYLVPVGYQSNNLFTCNWSNADFGELCFNDCFEFLYQMQTGTRLDVSTLTYQENPYYYHIPASSFEQSILPYFDITTEQLRKRSCYDSQQDSYPWLDIAYDNLSYFPLLTPEVVSCTQNSDGTITLTVDAMCVGLKTDSLFRHAVTIRPHADGSFQYVQNQLLTTSQELPAYKPRLAMQRSDA